MSKRRPNVYVYINVYINIRSKKKYFPDLEFDRNRGLFSKIDHLDPTLIPRIRPIRLVDPRVAKKLGLGVGFGKAASVVSQR